MALLIFQGTALALTLRYSRAKKSTEPYLPSVAVIFTELAKLSACSVAQFLSFSETTAEGKFGELVNPAKANSVQLALIYAEIARDSAPLFVPAVLFVLQQVLVIVAASYLNPVAFEIFGQSFKIVPTAFFAVHILGQRLSTSQWLSLPVLIAGVVLVSRGHASGGGGDKENQLVGIVASSLGGLSSAYAGVYFEKYVKSKNNVSVWARNMQLSMWGFPLSVVYALLKDGRAIRQRGLLQGFDRLTWCVVLLQVFGGLIVGMVVKYTDNVLKNFANAISVVCTVILAIPFFGLWPNFKSLLGVAVIILSGFLYGNSVQVNPDLLMRRARAWGSRRGRRACQSHVHDI